MMFSTVDGLYRKRPDHAVLLSSFLAPAPLSSLHPSWPPTYPLPDSFFSLCRLPTRTLQRNYAENSKQVFSEKELLGLSPHFHVHVSLSNLYIPTIHLPAGKYVDQSWKYINRTQTLGTEAAQFLFWEDKNGIFVAVYLAEMEGIEEK
jgi:hypothetical protein